MTTSDEIREGWRRRGIVGHCPVCHRKDWEDEGEVALARPDGTDPLAVGAMRCGNCSALLLVEPARGE